MFLKSILIYLEKLLKQYPNIDREELCEQFPRISLADYPELSGYSWEECHQGSLGGGALFLASEMALKMELEAGMRVLDLGCGHAGSSMSLARHYGVTVVAADKYISPCKTKCPHPLLRLRYGKRRIHRL